MQTYKWQAELFPLEEGFGGGESTLPLCSLKPRTLDSNTAAELVKHTICHHVFILPQKCIDICHCQAPKELKRWWELKPLHRSE